MPPPKAISDLVGWATPPFCSPNCGPRRIRHLVSQNTPREPRLHLSGQFGRGFGSDVRRDTYLAFKYSFYRVGSIPIRLATRPAVCCENHANKEVSMTEYEERSDRFTAIEDRFAGYEVYDQSGSKIGKVDDLFVDESDQPEYIGVKMGFLGTSSTLIPWAAVNTTDDSGRRIITSVDKAKVKDGPAFDDDREITPEFESEVHSYYGLGHSDTESGFYGSSYPGDTGPGTGGPGLSLGATGNSRFPEHAVTDEGGEQKPGGGPEAGAGPKG